MKQCIDSILGQPYEHLELVISDNASSDATRDICEKYAGKDKRVRYYRNERNIGGSRNHNRVFELSLGTYFAWIGHDDWRDHRFIERTVAALEARPDAVAACPRVVYVGSDGVRLTNVKNVRLDLDGMSPAARFAEAIRLDHLCQENYGLLRTETLRRTALERQFPDSDRVLAGELALYGPMLRLDEELIYRRWHSKSSIGQFPSRYDRMRWVNPWSGSSGQLALPYWREWLELLLVVQRTKLSLYDKWLAHIEAIRWGWKQRRRLWSDLLGWPVRASYLIYKRHRHPPE